jgi:hypothetical protein
VPIENTFPTCFDPYLRYIMDEPAAFRSLLNMDPAELPLSLLVRLKDGVNAAQFRERVLALDPEGEVHLGPAEDAVPFLTLRMPKSMAMTPDWLGMWDKAAASISLSVPVDPPHKRASSGFSFDPERPKSKAKTIIGILDDGCAFAHDRLLDQNQKSRVLAIWDQERGRQPAQISAAPLRVFGRRPADFDYGLEFWRGGGTSLTQPPAQEVGIDEWIALHLTPAGSVDEDRCYEHAGFVSLRRRETHGSHVTDVLAGRVPTSARLSIDRTTPPSFAPDTQAHWSDTDIVFVQIPRAGVEDASGAWLNAQITDGLRYILSCAGDDTKRVVFNVSYGKTTGPHDGTDDVEAFLSAMVAVFDGNIRKPALDVVLPAGNSRRSASHVTFKSTNAPTIDWTWRVPADNTVPVMAEVRVRKSDVAHVTGCTLKPPAVNAGQQHKLVPLQGVNDAGWLLTIPPTRVDPAAPLQTLPAGGGPALHGDWTISLGFDQPGVEVHAYLSRTDPNMGARPGAKQSRFLDPAWELAHGAAASQGPEHAAAAAVAASGCLISTAGTLSGIATGCTAHVYVAAGYCVDTQRASRYSSAGPSRDKRRGPDYALPTDENRVSVGIPGAGTRSGCVFRLVGTSTASPQLGRLLVGPSRPAPCPGGGAPPDADTGCKRLKSP